MNDLSGAELDWNLLRSFVAVAETGSLTRAAEQLACSQPTLSRQIASLEEGMGSALFERTARGLRLTQAGVLLLEPAKRVRAAVAELGMVAAGRGQSLAGTVRVTASEMVAAYVLPQILVGLRERHPEIQIELVASNRVDNLLEREADIAIRMVEPRQGGLISRKIASYALGFYANRDYLSQQKDAPSLNDFGNFAWVGLDRDDTYIAGFAAAGFKVGREFFAFRSDNMIACWQAVRAGLGIGLAMCCVGDADPLVQRLMPEVPLPGLPVWLTSHRELRDSARIRAVYDFLAEALALQM